MINRKLSCFPARNNFFHFFKPILINQIIHIRNPIFNTNNNNSIYILMLLKFLQSMYYNRFVVNFQKLLWLFFGMHSLSNTACKNYCNIHKSILHTLIFSIIEFFNLNILSYNRYFSHYENSYICQYYYNYIYWYKNPYTIFCRI